MPVISYLAHPHEGKKEELIKVLANFKECEVIPAQNKNILVVVTETQTKQEEDYLKQKLDALSSLKLLAMVSGFNTPEKK